MDSEQLNETIIDCRKCPRLVEFRERIAREKRRAYLGWEYWGRPVPGFGDIRGRVMAVGLAPGPHGSNRTGRMFTGDASGIFLYRALHKAGFANQPTSTRMNDGLMLQDIFITAVCRCVPPGNKPARLEISNCLPYLVEEITMMKNIQGFVALGRIAFENILSIFRSRNVALPHFEFIHNKIYDLGNNLPWLISSYHPSQQNTSTGRLTREMFDQVWLNAIGRLL